MAVWSPTVPGARLRIGRGQNGGMRALSVNLVGIREASFESLETDVEGARTGHRFFHVSIDATGGTTRETDTC